MDSDWARASVLLLAALLTGPGQALATMVRSVSVREMLAGSEIVFEGRVREVHTETGETRGAIRTCAQFQVMDVIKGPPGTRSIELCFAGGAYGGLVREVSGMVYPQVGEHGVYFVETLRRPLVHPLYGWEQGHFRIEPNEGDGGDLVKSADGHPVLSLNADRPSAAVPPHPGIAAGVEIHEGIPLAEGSKPVPQARSPLSSEAFKARLRELLAAPRP